MMQLLCDGVVLDLYDNAGLQFKHNNPLFAFDKLECERTTSFKLPCTAKNDKVLKLARIPAYDGVGMRRKFTAQLQSGTIVKDGYLYIDAFDGKDYNAIFVTGDFVGLQAIKNLGKLKDIITFTETVTFGSTPVYPSVAANNIWANVRYKHDNDIALNPSIQLGKLYDAICAQYNIASQAIPPGAAGVRIIPAELKSLEKIEASFTATQHNMSMDGDYPLCYEIALSKDFNILTISTAEVEYWITYSNNSIDIYGGTIQQYVTHAPIKLMFPNDWDDNLFVGYFKDDGATNVLSQFVFMGDRSFNSAGTVSGDSLRGRSVDVALNGKFVIIDKSMWVNRDFSGGHEQGWQPIDVQCDLGFQGGDIVNGAEIRLQDNLPDITFTDLLKTIAALSGRVLNYSEANGLVFEELDVNMYDNKDVDKLTKKSEVKRVFADYKQNNYVHFDDEKADKIITDYTIDNVNLELENNLQTIPFSEGANDGGMLYVYAEGEKPFMGGNDGVSTYLTRVSLPKNAGLQNLCDMSTQFKIEVRMNLLQYTNINEKTVLLIDGIKYLWTERSWQGDVAKLTLAKCIVTNQYYGLIEATKETIVNDYGVAVWNDLLVYVRNKPQIAPYVNNDPHLACSLVNTGYKRWLYAPYGQYITTDIPYTTDIELDVTFKIDTIVAYSRIIGLYSSNNYVMYINASGMLLILGNGVWTLQTGKTYRVTLQYGTYNVFEDGVLVKDGTITIPNYPGTTIRLYYGTSGGYFYYGSLGNKNYIRCGSVERTLVPYAQSTSSKGMLDLNTLTYYPNEGSGQFTINETAI